MFEKRRVMTIGYCC